MADKPEIGLEIATTGDGRDITRGYSGALLQPSDPVLAMRSGGDVRIYEQLLSDSQAGPLYQQRRLAVISKEWIVEPGGNTRADKLAAESLSRQIEAAGWDNITEKMLFGVWYGYAVAELIYARDGAEIVIDKIKVRNRRRFRFTPQGELRLLTLSNMTEGLPAPAPYFWHFATGHDNDDEPYGLGIAHWLYWPVLFKRNGIKFWLMFLEKFGQPTAVGKFEPGTSTGDRQRLLDALEAIQSDSGIAIPKSMEVELLEAARSGTGDYATLQDHMNNAIAKAILGQVASSQGTPGKLGSEDLQEQTRIDLVKADADLICESFNRGPARWLTEWNYPSAAPPRVRRVIEEQDDLDARSERDERLHTMGFRPSLAYVRETYGGDWTETQPAGDGSRTPARAPAEFAEGDIPRVTADARARHLAALQPAGDAVIEQWIERVRNLVDVADDFEDLNRRIEAEFSEIEPEQLADVLALAMAASHLAGRYDIHQGF